MNSEHGGSTFVLQQSPLHVAIIMDGSGRWALARSLPRMEGHRAGRTAVRRAVAAALERRIRILTLFTFSTDNWCRPENEVAELMRTFEGFFRADGPEFAAQGVRVTAFGRRDRLPRSLREVIEQVEASSLGGERLHVRFAIDYSGREAILSAAHRLQRASDISPESFSRALAETEPDGQPTADVDLLIRTGGEQRLSNCPLWEVAYAELYFSSCLWPDFGPEELDAALQEFAARERRFGRIKCEPSQAIAS